MRARDSLTGSVMSTYVDAKGRTHCLEHHPTLLESCQSKLAGWEEIQHSAVRQLESQRRCGKCWLRGHQCYCGVLSERRKLFDSAPDKYAIRNTEIVIYYAFKEIGRGPNTAHIMEQLLPGCTSQVILGLPEQEKKLIDELVEEYRSHRVRTCIMYPVKEAQVISEWKDGVTTYNSSSSEVSEGESNQLHKQQEQEREKKTRLVVLDGTYGDARRMFNYLKICLEARGVPCPVVKLDIGEGEFIKSAYLGIMDQPGRDKICTFQAVIMAMRDLGELESLCSALSADLDSWVHYILDCRIKPGKEDIKVPSDLYEARGATGGKHKHNKQNELKQATQAAFAPSDSVKSRHERNLEMRGKGKWGKAASKERAIENRRERRQRHQDQEQESLREEEQSWWTSMSRIFCYAAV